MKAKFQFLWRKILWPRLWILAVVVMVAVVATDEVVNLRLTWKVSALHLGWTPAPDPASPSGYADNQHNLILPYIGMDGYHWVMQTQQMLAGGPARIREVSYDNTPDGREVHWSSAFRWWLALLAKIDHFYTGTPLPQAVEAVVPFANTLLVTLLLMAMAPLVARRFGPGPGALFAFGAVGIYWIYESFTEGRTDHHGLAVLNSMWSVLFLLGGGAGWVKTEAGAVKNSALAAWLPDRTQARRWFIAAGVAGGIGLWISTASEAPVLAEIGLGALLATGLLARGASEKNQARPDPTLWRVWGWAGAATSMFFYLLEYFPSHMGLRLEVNHPLYALAWAGGGELLCQLSRWWGGEKLAATGRDRVMLVAGALAVAAAPLAILLFADKVFWVADRFLWIFHMDHIMEFTDMWTYLKDQPLWAKAVMMNPLFLLAIPMAIWTWRGNFPRPAKALMLLALPPGVITFVLSMTQIRWAEVSYGLWLAALVGVMVAVRLRENIRPSWPRKIAAALLLAFVLLPNPSHLIWSWTQNQWAAPMEDIQTLEMITRDVAQKLRQRVGHEPTVVISGATSTTWLTYWGGFQGLGTLYWENLPGLKANAEIYGASTFEQALPLLQKHRAKYLVLLSWVDKPEEYARLSQNLRNSDPVPQDAFVWRMQNKHVIPSWLRPVYHEMPNAQLSKRLFAMIYEVVPNQTTPDALARLAQWYVADGNFPAAASLLDLSLKMNPNNLPAMITAARLDLVTNQKDQFSAIWQRLQLLSVLGDPLELGDRIDLATIFFALDETAGAQRQLSLALRQADEESLRHLRVDSLYNLLFIAAKMHLLETRPGLWPYANPLLTPSMRIKLFQDCADTEMKANHPRNAIPLLYQALTIDPSSLNTLFRLGWLLATSPDDAIRNGPQALMLAKRTREIDLGKRFNVTDLLACAYASTGDFTQAVALEHVAITQAENANLPAVANALRAHLALFENKQPYLDQPPIN